MTDRAEVHNSLPLSGCSLWNSLFPEQEKNYVSSWRKLIGLFQERAQELNCLRNGDDLGIRI